MLVPLRFRTSPGVLSFMSTTTVFGTPVDVTFSELAIDMFFPADQGRRRRCAGRRKSSGSWGESDAVRNPNPENIDVLPGESATRRRNALTHILVLSPLEPQI